MHRQQPHRMGTGEQAPSRPNLLFVFADQLRDAALGGDGREGALTPHLDQFAAEGARLTDAVSTCPVCVPYRGSLLTGRYPMRSTVFTNNIQLPIGMPSLGTLLREAGYRTGYIGKWHLRGEPALEGYVPPGPLRHGFDYWAAHNCSHDYTAGTYYRDDPDPIPFPGWEADGQTELALDFLRGQAGAADPFALVLSWGPPHTPFIAPPEYEALYPPGQVVLRRNVRMVDDWVRYGDNPGYDGPYRDPEMVLKHFTARYHAAVTHLDHNFGRLLAALERLDLAQNTVVVFTADHGEMLGSHGHLHKLQPWDESVRVPFLLRYPDAVPAGLRCDAPFGTPDILPTLFGLMGVGEPDGVEGSDLSPILRGGAMPEPASSLLMCVTSCDTWGQRWTDFSAGGSGYPPGYLRPYRGIRTRTHTYVRDLRGPWQLYDNAADPYQMVNLLETRGARALPPELERELDDWLERTGDYFGGNAEYQHRVDLSTGLVTDPGALTR